MNMATATKVTSEPTCVACGELTVGADRRNLRTEASKHVLPLWRSTISSKIHAEPGDLDGILDKAGWQMCRKCFYAYEKALKAQAVIDEKATKAIRVLTAESASVQIAEIHPPPPKRRPPPVFLTSSSGTESDSPEVAVSQI